MDRGRLAELIESRRQEILASVPTREGEQFLKEMTELTQALPVWGDFDGWWYLRSVLTVVVHRETDDLKYDLDHLEVENVQAKRIFVHAMAARKFPELAELKPERPPDAVDCDQDHKALEKLRELGYNFECHCAGLGWQTR